LKFGVWGIAATELIREGQCVFK